MEIVDDMPPTLLEQAQLLARQSVMLAPNGGWIPKASRHLFRPSFEGRLKMF